MEKIIQITKENIEAEHLCCAFSSKNTLDGVANKKELIKKNMDKGYIFKKLDVRGKVFAEYCPLEISMLPVNGENYMALNCFWVSGQYAKKGYAGQLMKACLEDSKDKNGIVYVGAKKKVGYLTDKKFFLHYGFEVCDAADPYFELLVYKNKKGAPNPTFFDSVRGNKLENSKGIVVYYSDQCPFTDYYTNVVFKALAQKYKVPFKAIHLTSRDDIQDVPMATTKYGVFLDGTFITHEVMGPTKIEKLLG